MPISMDDIPKPIPPKPSRLLDRVRHLIRSRNLAYSTEKTYVTWIIRFIRFHQKRHPDTLSETEIEAFLNHLSVKRNCSVNTQKVALNALVFLYREFLKKDLKLKYIPAKAPQRIPTVFTHLEALNIIEHLIGVPQLIARLMYGSGLRINECLRLRVKDVDFGMNNLHIRESKGHKDRITLFPLNVITDMQSQLDYVKVLHQRDIKEGFGDVYLPNALDKKYPSAGKSLAWQSVGTQTIPIEVKSGTTGTLKSLNVFLNEKKLGFGVRFNAGLPSLHPANFSLPGIKGTFQLLSLPLYLVEETKRLIKEI